MAIIAGTGYVLSFEEIMGTAKGNEETFENLLKATGKGNVVPFVGAGLSVPYYPLWSKSLEELEKRVERDSYKSLKVKMKTAHTEIEKCGILEEILGPKELCKGISKLFAPEKFTWKDDPDYGSRAAILLPWIFPDAPLLTTNLDQSQETIFGIEGHGFLDHLTPKNVSVEAAMQQQRHHGILYLHGRVSGELSDYDDFVFSEKQYERHYIEGSALLSVLRGWMEGTQLLFLGCSLQNDRTLELLKKISREKTRLVHFAILEKPKGIRLQDRLRQLREEYNIWPIIYPRGRHEAVRIILERLLQGRSPESFRNFCNTYGTLASRQDNAKLFNPQMRTSKFVGREEEMKQLKAFCEDRRPFLWWAVTGPGGSGKTRLMEELKKYQKGKKWTVRCLKPSEYTDDRFKEIQDSSRNLLVVADYAGEHGETLGTWIERLSDRSGAKLRLLLAEREPESGTDGSGRNHNTTNSLYECLETGTSRNYLHAAQFGELERMLRLIPLDDEALREMITSYAKTVFSRDKLSEGEMRELLEGLEKADPSLHRPLFALFVADSYLRGGTTANWNRGELLDELLDREERHILKRQKAYLCLTRQDEFLSNAVQLLRIGATIRGGCELTELPGMELLKARLEKHDKNDCARFLRSLHMTDSSARRSNLWVNPIQPDLLGEYFILREFARVGDKQGYDPIKEQDAWNEQVLMYLLWVLNDYEDHKDTAEKCRDMLDRLVEHALVAKEDDRELARFVVCLLNEAVSFIRVEGRLLKAIFSLKRRMDTPALLTKYLNLLTHVVIEPGTAEIGVLVRAADELAEPCFASQDNPESLAAYFNLLAKAGIRESREEDYQNKALALKDKYPDNPILSAEADRCVECLQTWKTPTK